MLHALNGAPSWILIVNTCVLVCVQYSRYYEIAYVAAVVIIKYYYVLDLLGILLALIIAVLCTTPMAVHCTEGRDSVPPV